MSGLRIFKAHPALSLVERLRFAAPILKIGAEHRATGQAQGDAAQPGRERRRDRSGHPELVGDAGPKTFAR
jgi:hypothetical protein